MQNDGSSNLKRFQYDLFLGGEGDVIICNSKSTLSACWNSWPHKEWYPFAKTDFLCFLVHAKNMPEVLCNDAYSIKDKLARVNHKAA